MDKKELLENKLKELKLMKRELLLSGKDITNVDRKIEIIEEKKKTV